MKIELSYKLVHGTDRGGEDVSLHVELTSTRYPSREDVEKAFGECLATFAEDEVTDPTESESGVAVDDGFVVTCESEYGFRVKHTVEKVREDVLQAHLAALDPAKTGPEWVQVLKSGAYKLEFDLYTHGNAD